MKINRICLPLAGALAVCGCVHYAARPLDAAKNLERLEQRSLSDPGLCAFVEARLPQGAANRPPAAWDLDSLALAAYYFHPDLEVARARYETAAAAVGTAGQRPNPSAGLSTAYNVSSSGGISPWILGLNIDVPVETAGKRGLRIDKARQLVLAEGHAFMADAWTVRSRVRQALLDHWSAVQKADRLNRLAGSQAEVTRIMAVQRDLGEAQKVDLLREEAALEQLRMMEKEAEGRIAQTRVALAAAVGIPTAALDGVKIDGSAFAREPSAAKPDEARRSALLGRADILALLAEYAASEADLRLEIAKQYPDLHLGPSYEFDQDDSKWGVGIGLDLPVLNRNRGGIAEAEARRRMAAARFDGLQASIIGKIEAACAALEAQRRQAEAAARVLEKLERQAEATRRMCEMKELPAQALALVRLECIRAELAQLDVRQQAQQAQGDLENALQRPLDMPLTPEAVKADERKTP